MMMHMSYLLSLFSGIRAIIPESDGLNVQYTKLKTFPRLEYSLMHYHDHRTKAQTYKYYLLLPIVPNTGGVFNDYSL